MLETAAARRQKARNVAHAVVLFGCLLAVAAGLGWLLFGTTGLVWLGGIALAVLLLRPRIPVPTVLALYGAVPVPVSAAPELIGAVQRLAWLADLDEVPTLYYAPVRAPEAFSIGSGGNAALVVSDGLLYLLSPREIVAVLAHETSHLRAGDTTIMRLAHTVGRLALGLVLVGLLTVLFGQPLALPGLPGFLILAASCLVVPFLVPAIQLAFSRSREFEADVEAARLTGDPESLAVALEDLQAYRDRSSGRAGRSCGGVPDPWLVRTHPASAERARRLRRLESGPAPRPWLISAGRPPSGRPTRPDR